MAITVCVRPRLENISWSLYWKEPLEIQTQCLDDVELQVPESCTGKELLQAVAKHLHWRDVDSLERIKGFEQPWERLILRGRELDPQTVLPVKDGAVPLVVVRRVLKADGWRIRQEDDFLTSDEDDF